MNSFPKGNYNFFTDSSSNNTIFEQDPSKAQGNDSLIGQNNPFFAFGTPNKLYDEPAPKPSIFQSSLGLQNQQRFAAFTPVTGYDTITKKKDEQKKINIPVKYQSITCMEEHQSKAFEELRLEDYSLERHKIPPKTNAFTSGTYYGQQSSGTKLDFNLNGQQSNSFGTFATPTATVARGTNEQQSSSTNHLFNQAPTIKPDFNFKSLFGEQSNSFSTYTPTTTVGRGTSEQQSSSTDYLFNQAPTIKPYFNFKTLFGQQSNSFDTSTPIAGGTISNVQQPSSTNHLFNQTPIIKPDFCFNALFNQQSNSFVTNSTPTVTSTSSLIKLNIDTTATRSATNIFDSKYIKSPTKNFFDKKLPSTLYGNDATSLLNSSNGTKLQKSGDFNYCSNIEQPTTFALNQAVPHKAEVGNEFMVVPQQAKAVPVEEFRLVPQTKAVQNKNLENTIPSSTVSKNSCHQPEVESTQLRTEMYHPSPVSARMAYDPHGFILERNMLSAHFNSLVPAFSPEHSTTNQANLTTIIEQSKIKYSSESKPIDEFKQSKRKQLIDEFFGTDPMLKAPHKCLVIKKPTYTEFYSQYENELIACIDKESDEARNDEANLISDVTTVPEKKARDKDTIRKHKKTSFLVSIVPENAAGVVLTKPGYYTIPALADLHHYVNEHGDCIVRGFTIGRKGYGNVYFEDEVNVTGLNLDEIVSFEYREIDVYPNDELKPKIGQGLNRPAQVTLDQIYPMNGKTKKYIKDVNVILESDFVDKLIDLTIMKKRCQFVEYRAETGSWVFQVKHFSRYEYED